MLGRGGLVEMGKEDCLLCRRRPHREEERDDITTYLHMWGRICILFLGSSARIILTCFMLLSLLPP